MKIQDIVDTHHYKWVVPSSREVQTSRGIVHLVRGTLYDGATGPLVRDLDLEAFGTHDELYRRPVIEGVRISKTECDLIYGELLVKAARRRKERSCERAWCLVSSVVRPFVLITCPISWQIWAHHRYIEHRAPDWWLTHARVPHHMEWVFPTCRTIDAVYKGGDTSGDN